MITYGNFCRNVRKKFWRYPWLNFPGLLDIFKRSPKRNLDRISAKCRKKSLEEFVAKSFKTFLEQSRGMFLGQFLKETSEECLEGSFAGVILKRIR